MRRVLLLLVLCSSVLLLDVDVALAKKGAGGRGPRGPSKSSRLTVQPKYQAGNIQRTSGFPVDRQSGIRPSALRGGQRLVNPTTKTDPRLGIEERKLDHRLRTAQHLRDNAARNGNANLLNTADRMEQGAFDHYDSRLDRLGGGTGEVDFTGGDPDSLTLADDLTASPPTAPLSKPLGKQSGSFVADNSLGKHRQSLDSGLAVEARNLQSRLDIAQRLRDIAGRNEDENLLRTAERLEQIAISRYEHDLGLRQSRASEISQPEASPVFPNVANRP